MAPSSLIFAAPCRNGIALRRLYRRPERFRRGSLSGPRPAFRGGGAGQAGIAALAGILLSDKNTAAPR